MTTYVQTLCAEWGESSLGGQLRHAKLPAEISQLLVPALSKAGVALDAPVTGRITEGLIKDPAAQGEIGFIIEDVVLACYAQQTLSLPLFLSGVVRAWQEGGERAPLPGVIARALVSFPSFLRELDLRERLSLALSSNRQWLLSSKYLLVDSTPDHTLKEKADFRVQVALDFRVWTYRATPRGLAYAHTRLKGERGSLSKGLYLLLPYNNQEGLTVLGWDFYSDAQLRLGLKHLESDAKSYRTLLLDANENIQVLAEPNLIYV